jgi:hypothetical protein
MAEVRSGSFRTNGYSDPGYTDHYVFSWTLVTQSIPDNTSTISWSVTGAGGTNSAYWTYLQEKYVTVNGVTQTNTTKVATSNGTVAFSGTTTIKHANNGKGSFSASCGGAFYYYGSYNSTGSGSWDLPTIARATTPTVSATSVTMGSAVTINLSPADSSFKHKLTYAFGSLSGQTSGIASGTNFTASGTVGVAFTPPTSLGSQIPNANSGTCTITCYTYNSGGTHIGTTTKTITLNVPSYTPTCSVALSGVNLLSGTYVQEKSSVKVTITAATSYGASIKSYSTVIDGKTYTSQSFTTSVLSTGTKTATTTITDSRGKTVSVNSASITVYAYSIPYITSFSLARQSDGTTVIATLKGGFAAVNNKNAKTIKVTLNGVPNTVTTSAYTFDTTTTFTNVSTDQTFTSTLTLTDAYTTVTKDAVLPTVAVTMDFYKDGNGIAMGKVAENGNLLDIAWNERVRENLDVDGNINGINIHTGNYIFGGSREGITDENWIANVPSFIGTYSQNDQWYSTISLRHRNGGEDGTKYGLQLRSILTQEDNLSWRQNINDSWKNWKTILDSNNTADYVVAQGTSGIWTYRKWNSGVAECWGAYEHTTATTKTWGSLYYSDSLTPRISYPFTFASRPTENVTFKGNSVAGWLYTEGGGFSFNSTTQTGQYGVCRPTSIASAQLTFDYYVIGKWK